MSNFAPKPESRKKIANIAKMSTWKNLWTSTKPTENDSTCIKFLSFLVICHKIILLKDA